MKTKKATGKELAKAPRLKAAKLEKKRGSGKSGQVRTSSTNHNATEETQPSVWGDIDVIEFPACHDSSQIDGDSSCPDTKRPPPDAADKDDTDDEAWVDFTDYPLESLNRHLMAEVREYARKSKSDTQCAMCPFRRFQKPWRVREHLRRYHTEANNWCASGIKQLRVCVALHDSDKISNPGRIGDRPNYLRRSASIIRANFGQSDYGGEVTDNLSRRNLIDKDIRLAQYSMGPEIQSTCDIRNRNVHLHSVGYGYYSE